MCWKPEIPTTKPKIRQKPAKSLYKSRKKMKTNRCNGVCMYNIHTHTIHTKCQKELGTSYCRRNRKEVKWNEKTNTHNTLSLFLCFVQFAIHLTANLRISNATSVFRCFFHRLQYCELLCAFMVIFGQMYSNEHDRRLRSRFFFYSRWRFFFSLICCATVSVHLLQFCSKYPSSMDWFMMIFIIYRLSIISCNAISAFGHLVIGKIGQTQPK